MVFCVVMGEARSGEVWQESYGRAMFVGLECGVYRQEWSDPQWQAPVGSGARWFGR